MNQPHKAVIGSICGVFIFFKIISWLFYDDLNSLRIYDKNHATRSLHFIAIGDYGTGDSVQEDVAYGMKKFLSQKLPQRPEFVLSTGDQIYEHGIQSTKDFQLQTKFEQVYKMNPFLLPWYITLGNHDCEGSINAMLDYSKINPQWHFPSRYYYYDHRVDATSVVRIIVLDTCDLVCGSEIKNFRCEAAINAQTSVQTRTKQLKWLNEVLAMPSSPGIQTLWKIVMGHWSIYSYAGNGPTQALIDHVQPLLMKHRVHAYFNGHDHTLQHISRKDATSGWNVNYFISGAGGYRSHVVSNATKLNLHHISIEHGFMWCSLDAKQLHVDFINSNGESLYTTHVPYVQKPYT